MALRGVVALIFGIVALRNPNAGAGAVVVAFAVFAFADGIVDFVLAGSMARDGQRWGWYLFEGLVSIAAGIIALANPRLTLLALVVLVGVRAVVIGFLEFGAAFSWPGVESR